MSDCIVKPKNYKGYRRARFNGRVVGAHRIAWEKANGPIPEGMSVCHRCNNKSCENPDHLYLGTHKQNIQDAWADGLVPKMQGERHGKARLTEQQVLEIRASDLSRSKLAEMYQVHRATIQHIVERKSWRHI